MQGGFLHPLMPRAHPLLCCCARWRSQPRGPLAPRQAATEARLLQQRRETAGHAGRARHLCCGAASRAHSSGVRCLPRHKQARNQPAFDRHPFSYSKIAGKHNKHGSGTGV